MNKVKTLFLSIIISLAVAAIAFAWTNPSTNPPGGGGALYFSNGNVGIGTTGPQRKFVVADANPMWTLKRSGSSVSDGMGWTAWSPTGSNQFRIFEYTATDWTTGADRFVIDTGGNVGIGTTSPSYKLEVAAGYVNSVSGYKTNFADYAEYFYTNSQDLEPGEIVCVDLLENNVVKRCERGHDNNVMGIVSTNPAIIGNNLKSRESDAHWTVIGMLGQVEAFVSAENGSISVGDSLTSASSTPGYAMRADGGDSTVGVALEPLNSGTGKIKVLISRRNKSLAVEEVEALVVERIANMKIEDKVQQLITGAVNNLNLNPKITAIAQAEAGKLDSALSIKLDDVNGIINNFRTQTLASLTELNSQISALGSGFHITDSQGEAIFSRSRAIGALPNRDMSLTADNILLNGNVIIGKTPLTPLDNGGEAALCLGGVCKNAWDNYVGLESEILSLRSASLQHDNFIASTTALTQNISIDVNGNIIIGKDISNPPAPFVKGGIEIVDITTITASSSQAALVVNQAGDGQVADFQASGVSIMNIDNQGQVKIIGSLLVDGRIMVCTGGFCSDSLDAAVEETMADLGVEGKVVAGAFEGYCADGYVWVPGSAKYGTLPGFCVMSDLAGKDETKIPPTPFVKGGEDAVWSNVSQGQAQYGCQSLGAGYHLISENEWLTLAENILQVTENNLASSTLKLTNDNVINNLSGEVGQWTSQSVPAAGLPVAPSANAWYEYNEVADYKGLNIAPDYYLTDAANHIGKIYVGSGAGLKGFVRGFSGIYGLDLSHAPAEKSETIGFRCAK